MYTQPKIRTSFRPRPIEVGKPLPVYRHAADLREEDQGVDEECILQEALAAVNELKPANLPIPQTILVEKYNEDNPLTVQQPQHYIRFTPDEVEKQGLYECDTEDERFIEDFGGEKKGLTEGKLCAIIDRLEKASFDMQGQICPQSALDAHVQGRPNALSAAYEHWVRKRNKFGKALIRKYQTPTSINDPSPHATFRPREKEQTRYRRTRKNDKEAYQKIRSLRLDFDRVRNVLTLIIQRERLKKDLVDISLDLQHASCLKDKDPLGALAILRDQEAKLKRRKPLPMMEPPAPKQPKPKKQHLQNVATAVAPTAEEGEDQSGDADPADDEMSNVVPQTHTSVLNPRYHRLMQHWDDAEEFSPGSCILPVTRGGFLLGQESASVPAPMRALPHVGRARLGRGGRVIFDRCLAAPKSWGEDESNARAAGNVRRRESWRKENSLCGPALCTSSGLLLDLSSDEDCEIRDVNDDLLNVNGHYFGVFSNGNDKLDFDELLETARRWKRPRLGMPVSGGWKVAAVDNSAAPCNPLSVNSELANGTSFSEPAAVNGIGLHV